jgi:hypothetical protein
VNGGMEVFSANVPTGWNSTTPAEISQETAQGRVHSGSSAVNIGGDGILTQDIPLISPGCYYEFSFFARGQGAQVGLTAAVTFLTPGGTVPGASIVVRMMDIPTDNREFAYYRVLTDAAPVGVTLARLSFSVTTQDSQSLDLDDVSFATQ